MSTSSYQCTTPILIEGFVNETLAKKSIGYVNFKPASKDNVVIFAIDKNKAIHALLKPNAQVISTIRKSTVRRRRTIKSQNHEPVLVTMNGESKYMSTNNTTHTREDFLNAIKLAAKNGNERLKSLTSD
ncbi:MAG: hypothetical protein RR448_12340 [Niameybacter sp.]